MKKMRISSVWFVPVVAVLIGLWMFYKHVSELGPLVTITTVNADGLVAGKTTIKSRSVDIGMIESIELSSDYSHTIVKARLNKQVKGMLVQDSKFWVVKPRIGRGGVSGLSTLLSGAYIELRPGQSKTRITDYVLMEEPPLGEAGRQGISLHLFSGANKSLERGAPVHFKGFTIGQVEQASYDKEKQQVHYKIFIEAPFNELVSTNTAFWITSAFEVKMNAKGITFQLDSLESFINGGITFGLPDGSVPQGLAEDNANYELFANETIALEGSYRRFTPFVLFFEESIGGLVKDAPVEFRGVRVGTVVEVPYLRYFDQDVFNPKGLIPVLIHIEYDRWNKFKSDLEGDAWKSHIQEQVSKDMRATLMTGNILTGARYIDISNSPDVERDPYVIGLEQHVEEPIMHTRKGDLERVGNKINSLLDKVNALPLEPVLNNLNTTLKSANSAVKRLDSAVEKLDRLIEADSDANNADLREVLQQLKQTLASYDQGSPLYQDLRQSNQSLDQVMWELKPLLDTLNNKPDSLVFGADMSDPNTDDVNKESEQ
ncbi:intermembrane transport protein PqiB [Echinimonas agarilytica]|uniref:Intermembrane transport protein PqiB n=1 Tax=Echinimonas agarilytica TaxID=1215918 RepID=A0AA42B6P6_9GAMM|nr:intermembrane transport protein PqiB [Echinimonas agarilytica]MCM2679027.1 intermembrane transport protein PqiB [Echinimonas agarilytica]